MEASSKTLLHSGSHDLRQKSDVVREIYFRQDRPGIVIILEADSVDAARDVQSQMPLQKAGLLDFEYIPFANYTFWENLFAPEHKEGGK